MNPFPHTTATAVLALGSNVGDPLENLREAAERIHKRFGACAFANVYKTPPQFYTEQPDFLNTAVAFGCVLAPLDLLKFCKDTEFEMGRRPAFRNAPRPIDLDILFLGSQTVSTELLTIPHIGWRSRAFVITPLLDLRDAGVFDSPDFAAVREFLADKTRAFEIFAQI